MGAFQLVRAFANVDAHGAGAHAFLAMDAVARVGWEKDLQRVAIGEHVLQVAVGADRGAEALTEESEVEKCEQRDAGAKDAAGGADVE